MNEICYSILHWEFELGITTCGWHVTDFSIGMSLSYLSSSRWGVYPFEQGEIKRVNGLFRQIWTDHVCCRVNTHERIERKPSIVLLFCRPRQVCINTDNTKYNYVQLFKRIIYCHDSGDNYTGTTRTNDWLMTGNLPSAGQEVHPSLLSPRLTRFKCKASFFFSFILFSESCNSIICSNVCSYKSQWIFLIVSNTDHDLALNNSDVVHVNVSCRCGRMVCCVVLYGRGHAALRHIVVETPAWRGRLVSLTTKLE